ncbi:MAG: DNA replication/repair protein RecF [Oscillospiraceae bacterium]|jgi:DNA replication and repair protein RecF|nr:DNA replication/repair protein RecF [Oscillospiraceae bacterium]
MILNSLRAENFRNIISEELLPSGGTNILIGQNGQGKTNLIEAIWMLTGAKSFRSYKNSELIRFGEETAKISSTFYSEGREQSLEVAVTQKERTATLNMVKKQQCSEIIGKICAVVFSPEHMALVSEGASERRRFIDCAVCQMKPSFIRTIAEYSKSLSHRNALLKEIQNGRSYGDLLSIWDERLSLFGAEIAVVRRQYTEALAKRAEDIYSRLSSGSEKLEVSYSCSFSKAEERDVLRTDFMQKLLAGREADIAKGHTAAGVHRDDIALSLDEKPARFYASQGQKRSCVISLKLAEAEQMASVIGEKPIILLDDVMSELDNSRQQFLLSNVTDCQVFITCCDFESVSGFKDGSVFEIAGGEVRKRMT